MAVQTCLKKSSNYVKLELRALELSEIDLYYPADIFVSQEVE